MEVGSTPVSNSSRLEALALLGWMSREEALIFLQNECVQPDPLSASQAEELWLEHRRRVEMLPADAPRAAEILPMSEADVKAARRFRSRYPGEQSIVDIVRLNPMELIVHQHWISPSLSEPYAATSTPARWIQTALLDPPSASPSKPRRDGNTIVYDLPHPEFLLTERFGAEPLLQITEPKAFVTVGFHGGRAVLLTGYHRTFALARHLLTMPDSPRGVLFGVSNALDLLGNDAEDVKAMMTSARPPRLADFFSPELASSVRIRKRQYQIRIRYEVASLDAAEDADSGASAAGSVPETAPALPVTHHGIHTPAGVEKAFETARSLQEQRRYEEAIQTYAGILKIRPNMKAVHSNLASIFLATGRIAEAKAHAERIVFLDPADAEAHFNLGVVLQAEGRLDTARRYYMQALAIDPANSAVLVSLGQVLAASGELDNGVAHFRQAIGRKPDCTEAWFRLAEIKTFLPDDPDLAALERLASEGSLAGKDAAYLHFALGKALEDCGQFSRAFGHYRIGNELQRQLIPYDERKDIELARNVTQTFGRETIERLEGSGSASQIPVFVVGMPRSGTTLIEQILASHHQVHGAGELEVLPALFQKAFNAQNLPAALDRDKVLELAESYLGSLPQQPGRTRIVDKLPGNFHFAGLIHLMFPNARIIHAIRNPVDTCVSCYSKLFWTGHDLAELGRYYTRYSDLMAHWRAVLPPHCILDVHYEELIHDFDAQAARMLDFCGLDWDNNCCTFYQTSRPVRTASMAQVRKPLYSTSVERWRRFEEHLEPLLLELKPLELKPLELKPLELKPPWTAIPQCGVQGVLGWVRTETEPGL